MNSSVHGRPAEKLSEAVAHDWQKSLSTGVKSPRAAPLGTSLLQVPPHSLAWEVQPHQIQDYCGLGVRLMKLMAANEPSHAHGLDLVPR
jgi:hypothetical protein